jgi:hypothetical protein
LKGQILGAAVATLLVRCKLRALAVMACKLAPCSKFSGATGGGVKTRNNLGWVFILVVDADVDVDDMDLLYPPRITRLSWSIEWVNGKILLIARSSGQKLKKKTEMFRTDSHARKLQVQEKDKLTKY